MKIVFLPGSCVPFDGNSLLERPLGGTETAVIRLAEALSELGHKVFVLSHIEHPRVTRPLYVPYRAIGDLGTVDVAIGVRELLSIFTNISCRTRYYWTGDSYDQLQSIGLGDHRVIRRLNAFLAVSSWQADRICSVSGFPRERTYILRNGHAHELFAGDEIRNPYRLIYTSTPYRGLIHLPTIFEAIKTSVPECELHVFSGMKVYEGASAHTAEVERAFDSTMERLKATPGVTVHGNILQAQLARELMKSRLMVYPNCFEETSCIAALEALAAGCPVVTSRRGALPETIGDAGVFIEGDPSSRLYLTAFVSAVKNLLTDCRACDELKKRALVRSVSTSWRAIAEKFTERLRSDLSRINSGEFTQMTP